MSFKQGTNPTSQFLHMQLYTRLLLNPYKAFSSATSSNSYCYNAFYKSVFQHSKTQEKAKKAFFSDSFPFYLSMYCPATTSTVKHCLYFFSLLWKCFSKYTVWKKLYKKMPWTVYLKNVTLFPVAVGKSTLGGHYYFVFSFDK